MTLVNMGVDFAAAQEEAEKVGRPAPNDLYELQVLEVQDEKDGEPRIDKNGKPFWIWKLKIINSDDQSINGKWVSHMTYIPDNGDCSRVKQLIDIMQALDIDWGDGDFETDDAVGLTCRANLGTTKDGKWNEISSFA